MSVILAGWEAEIQKIMVSGQLRPVVFLCHPSYGGKPKIEDQGPCQTGQIVRPYVKKQPEQEGPEAFLKQ
jgi:hypothetical protein